MTLDKLFFISVIERRETRRIEEVIGCEISHKAGMRQVENRVLELKVCKDLPKEKMLNVLLVGKVQGVGQRGRISSLGAGKG